MDALVIGADESLYLDSGVCKAIHTIAGPKLLEDVRKLGGCKTGEAKITKAYNANARYMVVLCQVEKITDHNVCNLSSQ